MDLFSIFIIAIGLMTFFKIFQFKLTRRKMYELADKIPGPPGLPIIGSALDCSVMDDETLLKLADDLLERYMLGKMWIGHLLFVGVGLPEHLKTVLNSNCCLEKSYMYKFLIVEFGLMNSPCKYMILILIYS